MIASLAYSDITIFFKKREFQPLVYTNKKLILIHDMLERMLEEIQKNVYGTFIWLNMPVNAIIEILTAACWSPCLGNNFQRPELISLAAFSRLILRRRGGAIWCVVVVQDSGGSYFISLKLNKLTRGAQTFFFSRPFAVFYGTDHDIKG